MGLESVLTKNNMRTIWRGEETAGMEGKEEGEERLFKRALGLRDRLQAGVVLEGVRQRNCSIGTDVFVVDTATQ